MLDNTKILNLSGLQQGLFQKNYVQLKTSKPGNKKTLSSTTLNQNKSNSRMICSSENKPLE